MNTKIIEIDCCEHCPLIETSKLWYTPRNLCGHPDAEGMHIENILKIHPECPLEDDCESETF